MVTNAKLKQVLKDRLSELPHNRLQKGSNEEWLDHLFDENYPHEGAGPAPIAIDYRIQFEGGYETALDEVRLILKEIPYLVLEEKKFENYDQFATLIENRIKFEILKLKKKSRSELK